MNNGSIRQLVYMSVATAGSARDHADKIADKAAPKNRERDITGFLIADERNFMQLIEGDHDTIDALYAYIAADPRHTDMTVVWDAEADRRLLPDWGMRVIEASNAGELPGVGEDEKRLIDAMLSRLREHDVVPESFREHIDGVRELVASGIF